MRITLSRLASALAVGLLSAVALAGDAPKSGLQIGDSPSPFDVQDITGPNKGTTLCYRCQYGSSPVVCVFARSTGEPLAKLVKALDAEVARKGGELKSFVVVLTDDAEATSKALKAMAAAEKIKGVPLTVVEGPAGPPDYKIAKDADVTVMMWADGEVKANRAFAKGQLDAQGIAAVTKDAAKIAK